MKIKKTLIVGLILLISAINLSCGQVKYDQLGSISGVLVQLETGEYGIEGHISPATSITFFPKRVRYKLDKQTAKTYIEEYKYQVGQKISFLFEYDIKDDSQDWASIIHIVSH